MRLIYGSLLIGEVLNIQKRCSLYTGEVNTQVYHIDCHPYFEKFTPGAKVLKLVVEFSISLKSCFEVLGVYLKRFCGIILFFLCQSNITDVATRVIFRQSFVTDMAQRDCYYTARYVQSLIRFINLATKVLAI